MANKSGRVRTVVADPTKGECMEPLTDDASHTLDGPGLAPAHDVCALCADVLRMPEHY